MGDKKICAYGSGTCRKDAIDGKVFCALHLLNAREYLRGYRQKIKGGICLRCETLAVSEEKFCEYHLLARDEAIVRYQNRHRNVSESYVYKMLMAILHS